MEHRDKRQKSGFVLNPMDEVLVRKCDGMMKGLLKRTQAVHFSKPVDWKKMGLHEYPRLIKQPMDLGTVQERLLRQHYGRLEEMANDIRLVWKNAYLFNAPDSLYFKAAKSLSDVFEKKLEEFEREQEQINAPQLETMERCRILLEDMTANPFSEWFREPVDHEALGLVDYLQVIKEPQDLGSIAKKLARNSYMSPEDYARDVRLVWQNAITYNSATSMFGVVAAILWQTFDRRFALITNLASVDPGKPLPDRQGWPTFQQKKKFYDVCTRLSLADLNQIVSLVQRTCVSAVQNCGDKEVEVDVDELDIETFNKVMAWAQQKTKSG